MRMGSIMGVNTVHRTMILWDVLHAISDVFGVAEPEQDHKTQGKKTQGNIKHRE